MADFSIDQKNLPGVKEVCRDFALLEDHCLAHNLQEQEIESHLASNVYKSRLAQQDLQVAKRLQQEEDLRAKAESQRQHRRIERIDNEIAQEIQDQLVRQAEQQRQQEEKDEAIARKLHEREMKEERKRQKQMETNIEEEFYEDKASRFPSDLREPNPHSTSSDYRKEKHRDYNQMISPYSSPNPDRKRYPNSHSRYPEYEPVEFSRSKRPEITNKGREYYSPDRQPKISEDHLKERNQPLDLDNTEPRRKKKQDQGDNFEPVVRLKEKPHRDYSADRDRVWDKERNKDRERERDGQRTKDRQRDRNRTKSQDRLFSGDVRGRNMDRAMDQNIDGHRSRDRQRERGRDGNRERHRSRERELDYSLSPSRGRSEDNLEWEDFSNRPRLPIGPNEVFEEPTFRGHSNDGQSPGYSSRERGRKVRGEYGMKEATHGLAQLDLHDQEFRDLEVARKLQDEELKAVQVDKRAAQVAQDEEIARRLMEEEKREYKKSKDKEKQVIERRRPELEYKPVQEDVVRPRTREEVRSREEEYQRARNHKPARPPPPTQHYENINPSYAYVESPYSPRPPSRPEAAYKGAYYRQ
ncbi:coiled-coil domain-containing protein 50 isoform 1 [Danio rerio]|uniref:Coiled-coil domain-containing protein 50 isoform 1 n=1 Tax=Danio rerio TaxID=7955 RepID=A0AB13A9X1_DANRE|nr:coiled-coil domain-containing protein 50 isoform 1 [Danio rerio]|eukprot:XP_009294653.1 coiled-coil domain-containing protein 50 isoform X1 [Danio rerio]